MRPPMPPPSAQPPAAMTNLPPQVSDRVTAMYLDAQRMVSEQSAATWQRLFLGGLTQLDQDWSKSFAGYCGNRPACGLHPEQKPK